jgi:hypothetical protein
MDRFRKMNIAQAQISIQDITGCEGKLIQAIKLTAAFFLPVDIHRTFSFSF